MLAIRLNCSSKFFGTKVMTVYFEVTTWFVGYIQDFLTFPFSYASSGRFSLTYMVRGTGGGRLRLNTSSIFQSTSLVNQSLRFRRRCIGCDDAGAIVGQQPVWEASSRLERWGGGVDRQA